MKYLLGILASVVVSLAATQASAQTQVAQVTTNLNLRAGPDTFYPIITTIPGGAEVAIFGCTTGYGWCDVGFARTRGWVSADYLLFYEYGRPRPVARYGPQYAVPIIGFEFYDYSDRYYRGEPWYYERHRWNRDRPIPKYPRYERRRLVNEPPPERPRRQGRVRKHDFDRDTDSDRLRRWQKHIR